VDVRFDQSGHDRAVAEIDRAHVRDVARSGVADRDESPVPDRHGSRHVLRPSIVWIWPLTSASVSSAVWGGSVAAAWLELVRQLRAADVAAAPIAAAVAVPKKSLREMSDMVADSTPASVDDPAEGTYMPVPG
jgi:hypothetical protein